MIFQRTSGLLEVVRDIIYYLLDPRCHLYGRAQVPLFSDVFMMEEVEETAEQWRN